MSTGLALYRLDIPFTTTFTHAAASRAATQSVWVEASADGQVGVGEACPREYVTGESLESVEDFFRRHSASISREATSLPALTRWLERNNAAVDANPSAWCAVELALLDLLAHREGIPVELLLGLPPVSGTFIYSAVIGDSDVETFATTFRRYQALGFSNFKIKLSGDRARDMSKLDHFRGPVSDATCRVRVDANNLWTDSSVAIAHLTSLEFPFSGIDEPLAARAFDGMALIAEQMGCPIILDESLSRAEQGLPLARHPDRWIINLRVSKMGGVVRSLAVLDAARETGIPVIVGAQVGESSVLTRAGLTVASAAASSLAAQEGAFGTHLLSEDVADPPLMFGRAGSLNTDRLTLHTRRGWGLSIARPVGRSSRLA